MDLEIYEEKLKKLQENDVLLHKKNNDFKWNLRHICNCNCVILSGFITGFVYTVFYVISIQRQFI